MTARDAILARIREALRMLAVRPGAHDAPHPEGEGPGSRVESRGTQTTHPIQIPQSAPHGRVGLDEVSPHPPGRDFRALLPRVGATFEERVAAFAAASGELRTDFRVLASAAEVHAALAGLRDAEGWQRVAAHQGYLTAPVAEALGRPVLWTDGGYDKHALEQCDVGLTECDALVAQTGSVVVTSASAGGRALSVLPPHHVVLARRDQLVADLPAAFRLLQEKYAASYPSMISFITGPSRTGDIERILVLGAHGPKKLTVLCW